MDEFLAKYIVKKDSESKPITHTAMDGGKWSIPEKKLSKFWFDKIYRALLFEMQILKNVILNKSCQKREKAHRFLGVFLHKTFLDNNMALSNYSNSKTLSFIHSLSGH